MDVLKPELMWIEGICYRINSIDPIFSGTAEDDEYDEEDNYQDESCALDEPCDEFELEVTEGGRYRTTFHVARSYFPFIIGAKGATRRRLENETRTQIRVPRQGQDGNIIITGSDKKGVSAARRRINLIVISARQKQPFTHFLSIPMTGESIKEGFLKFKEEVLEKCKDRSIDSSIFQSPDKLHLTIGTLVLSDEEERKKAAKVLMECKETVIDPILEHQPLTLRMVGVEYMNDDPAEVDVLYGKIELKSSGLILQTLSDGIVDFFANSGLMEKQYEQVKLHVTLMNTLFREDKGGVSEHETSKRRHKPRESFDATNVLKMFENFNFGEQQVDNIHLSQRYTTSNTDGYYKASATISLT
ncbi:activating signal cointegrator 1 complex subunit 1 isoform X2 [Anabrus simplex]